MFAILRTAKLSSWGNVAGSLAHTRRATQQVAPNADPSKTHMNQVLVGSEHTALADIQSRVNEVTKGKIRKNGVLCIEYMLGASPEFFKGKSQSEIDTWVNKNVEFLKEKHGINLIHVAVHNDETSPHLVAYAVPEVNGKLNCREILGGREKVRKLQDSYAQAMSQFGLERGVEGSKSKHQTIKTFYAGLNKTASEISKTVKEVKIEDPPRKHILQSENKYNKELDEWKKEERRKVIKKVLPVIKVASRAESLKMENESLKESNRYLSDENEKLKFQLSATFSTDSLTKEDVAVLRKLDISLVAQRLDYLGEIPPKTNAIDLVKQVASFDYQQAVAWLACEFGPDVAGGAVAQEASVKPPERPLLPAESVIKKEVTKQLDALGCDKFRLTLVPSAGEGKPYLPGKTGETENFYSKKDVANMIPFLRFRNNRGDNVFVTPMDDNAFYVLLDDAKRSVNEWLRDGYTPCLAQKTSWESEQIVFKIPKIDNRELVLKYFNLLNKAEGDPEITGLRHPFRLAGFRNMKPKHERKGQHPFVKIERAVNTFCQKTLETIKKLDIKKIIKGHNLTI